jgi:hypothetical protein
LVPQVGRPRVGKGVRRDGEFGGDQGEARECLVRGWRREHGSVGVGWGKRSQLRYPRDCLHSLCIALPTISPRSTYYRRESETKNLSEMLFYLYHAIFFYRRAFPPSDVHIQGHHPPLPSRHSLHASTPPIVRQPWGSAACPDTPIPPCSPREGGEEKQATTKEVLAPCPHDRRLRSQGSLPSSSPPCTSLSAVPASCLQ